MGRKKAPSEPLNSYELPPVLTEEALESVMIAKATQLAYQQLCDGTASSQVITHYLKLGSTKERIEREILEKQKDLIAAKTHAIKSGETQEELYTDAINAMRTYSGTAEQQSDDT